jgi:molybdopterin-guanine dinucleotide biosynthesis protein A
LTRVCLEAGGGNLAGLADSALILAGGRGLRMGYDKKRLELDGKRVIDTLISRLVLLFGEVLVSSNDPFEHEGIRVLRDELGAGPLAGIYQGLKACRSRYLYVVACDMPFISSEYILNIRELLCTEEVDACVAQREDGFCEPFNAFFSKTCLEIMHEALVNGEYRPAALFRKLRLHTIDFSTLDRDMFFNINCEADLLAARQKGSG